MGSSQGKLTSFQLEVLRAFFARENRFFLTGGGALAGFHLQHRRTDDLDLFTLDEEAFRRGRGVLAEVAEELGATLEVRQDAPGFQQLVMTRDDQGLVVELVRERAFQFTPRKPELDGIRVDPPEEILANKITTIVSRSEERDLVDLLFLQRAGYRVESAIAAAMEKDGGCTPAVLAWVLSEIRIPDDTPLPAGVTPEELRQFVSDLTLRLRHAAFPGKR